VPFESISGALPPEPFGAERFSFADFYRFPESFMSSEEMLDWKSGLNEAGGRAGYAAELRAFMGLARDSVDHVFAALNRGGGGDAQVIVHEVREKAGRLGCRFLAARALDLELALRAGADTQVVYGRYASAVPDTLCAITAYLS
jgi:two-component system sensor histidine kinase/response regulator